MNDVGWLSHTAPEQVRTPPASRSGAVTLGGVLLTGAFGSTRTAPLVAGSLIAWCWVSTTVQDTSVSASSQVATYSSVPLHVVAPAPAMPAPSRCQV